MVRAFEEALIDRLDKKAMRIEDRLYGDGNLDTETRSRLKAELRKIYADMASVVEQLAAKLRAGTR